MCRQVAFFNYSHGHDNSVLKAGFYGNGSPGPNDFRERRMIVQRKRQHIAALTDEQAEILGIMSGIPADGTVEVVADEKSVDRIRKGIPRSSSHLRSSTAFLAPSTGVASQSLQTLEHMLPGLPMIAAAVSRSDDVVAAPGHHVWVRARVWHSRKVSLRMSLNVLLGKRAGVGFKIALHV